MPAGAPRSGETMRDTILGKIVAELEAPRAARPFGSGWIAGTLALLSGLTGLALVVMLRYPSLTHMPELTAIHGSVLFKAFLYFVLIWGFLLACLSMTLRADKTLGTAAMVLTLLATMIGSLPTAHDYQIGGLFFGLDFFVLNVLFTGALFIPVERLLPKNREQIVFRDEWREDLFYYLVSSLMVQVLTYLTFAPSNFVIHHQNISAVRGFARELPWIVQFIAIMLLTDLAQYWLHRAFHRVPALWRFHAVHHSAKSMDWIAGARMHFLEIVILRSVTATPMLVIGFHESVIQIYVLVVYVYSTFIHSNVGANYGWLEKIFVVPRFHHWHHGIEKEAIDVNFAIHFPFLDRLFGTHHLPEGKWPQGYGIAGHPVPRGYWKQLLYPFQRP
jgi:sterol desaturase/sphingolipid hydroxylase (fatty acid hydroxylase superfamily)